MKKKAFTFDLGREIASKCMELNSITEICDYLDYEIIPTLKKSNKFQSAYYSFNKLSHSLRSGTVGFQIFSLKGNVKLPFVSFSTLPVITCPGAGKCKEYCYSFKAWRHAGAYCRQLQNTILIKHNRELIAKSFLAIAPNCTVRLYVDGDFDSQSTLDFWFGLMDQRKDLNVYGYSKSWHLFLSHNAMNKPFPSNYCLNISDGSIFDDKPDYAAAMLKLPCVRGYYKAVPVNHPNKGFSRYESKEYHTEVRSSLRILTGETKVISCPGKCGSCGVGKHFCGNLALKGVTIGNGLH